MTCEGCHIIRNNDCPGDNCEWFGSLHEHAEDNPEHALLENLLSRYPHSHIRRRLRVIDGIQGRRQYLNRLLWEIQLDNQIPGPLGGIGGIGMHINWLNHRIQHLNLQIDIVTVTAIQLAASMMDARWYLLDIRELVNMAVVMADQALQDFQEGHGAVADNLGNAPQPPQGGEFPMAAFLEALQNPIDLFD